MAEGNAVGAGDLLEGRLAVGRGEHHDEGEDAATSDDELPALEAADAQHDGEHARHVERVVTGEEDVVHAREASKHDVEEHAHAHDECGVLTEVGQSHGHDGLVVRHDALHGEGVVEDLAEGEQGAGLQVAGAGGENQEAHDGLDGAHDNVLDRLLLKREAEESEKAN